MILVKRTSTEQVICENCYHFLIYDFFMQIMTAKRKKLKVRKFDGLSSSCSRDIEENYSGGALCPPPHIA